MAQEVAGVTVHEAARLLGMTESALRQAICRKQFPVMRFGTRVFVDMNAINRLLRENIVTR